MQKKIALRVLVIAAMMISMTLVLKQIRLFSMPQGGSVTLGTMVPLLLLSYRYGGKAGALAGCAYGLIDLLLNPYVLHPVQVLFDYPLPFMMMGLAALTKNIYLGTVLAFLGRFICHVISGVAFFASYAPEGTSPLMYSLIFNGTYIVPECAICLLILYFLPIKRLMEQMH